MIFQRVPRFLFGVTTASLLGLNLIGRNSRNLIENDLTRRIVSFYHDLNELLLTPNSSYQLNLLGPSIQNSPVTLFKSDLSILNKSNSSQTGSSSDNTEWKSAKSIYDFKVKDIDGNSVDLSKYKGKVVLIVNVACMCGLTTSNYTQLQELYDKYKDQGLSIMAFPSNQFGGQEPRPDPEIKEFVKKFNVEFDMFSKINVNGDTAHPLYKYLKYKQPGMLGVEIKWNFSKFLVDHNGVPVQRYAPTTPPKDIEKDIIRLLAESHSA